jgi:hypothetical protein
MEKRKTKMNRLGVASLLVEEAGSEPGIPAHALVAVLPPERFVTRHLIALTSREFYQDYQALSADERRLVVLALKRWRRELVKVDEVDDDQRPEEFFHQQRRGTQLDLSGIGDLRLSTAARRLADVYQGNIDDYGARSIAHLCPAARTLGSLKRAGVTTIEDLERVLAEGTKVPHLSSKERGELAAALADWQEMNRGGR